MSLLRHRSGNGPPIVLLHGLGLDWRSWEPVIPGLAHSHDVLALDLPGFGTAAPLPDGRRPSPGRLAAAVAEELDALGIPRAVVVGNSLGGWVALELARLGRATRVVALSPSGLETPPERAWLIGINELMRLRAKVLAPVAGAVCASRAGRILALAGLWGRPSRVDPATAADEVAAFARAPSFQPALAEAMSRTAVGALRAVDVPVTLGVGRRDLLLGTWTVPRFAALLSDARVVGLPGAGHVPMHDDPEAVTRLILDGDRSQPPPD
jgi:pimeloyl-ACP methyl ester carboxylesterase